MRSIYTEIIQPMIGEFFQVDSIFSSDCSSSSIVNDIDIDKELFLWSVLSGKQELAILFWSREKNKVCKYAKCNRL